ncbi:MAG TPA: hypothetical protein VF121_12435, partial [Thermoanaerobaculia bacterium]|nr:hypothetical protein [Thermoanaerobaculia bacterium]
MLSPRPLLRTLLLLAAAAAALPPALAAQALDPDDDARVPAPLPAAVAAPDPLATRLCDALHALPEAR